MATLIVESGPDAGRKYRLGNTTVLGRLSTNEIQISDPQASRTHTKIVKEADGYHAIDLGSRNGTVVNGIRAQNVLLKNGDRITIGKVVLRFEDSAPGAPMARYEQPAAPDAPGAERPPAPKSPAPGNMLVPPSSPSATTTAAGKTAPSPPPLRQALRGLSRPASSSLPTTASASQKPTAILPASKQKEAAGTAAPISERPRQTLRSAGSETRETLVLQGWKKWVSILLGLVLFVGLFFAARWVGEKAFSRLMPTVPEEEKLREK